MTLDELLADCYRRCGYATAPDTRVAATFRGFLNETQQMLAAEPTLAPLLRGSLSFATTAGRAEYGLPAAVSRVVTVRETTNNRRLRQMSLDWYRSRVPDQADQTGTPDGYVWLGPMAVSRQPSDASELFAKSTSASDVQRLFYEARTTDGTIRSGVVTLTGTTAVSLSSALTTVEEVTDLYLESAAVGTVTLLEDSGSGTQLASIGIGTTRSAVQGIAFVPTPSAATTYTLDYEREATDLVLGTDAPAWLPFRFHRLLPMGARQRYWEDKADVDRFKIAAAEFESERRKLVAYVNNPPDYVMVPGGGRGSVSDLGGWYPAGTVWD